MNVNQKYFTDRCGTKLCKGILNVLCLIPILFYGSEAMAFDLDAGVKAATAPLINVIESHWGKALLLIVCGGGVIREGKKKLNKGDK
jgi:hypothetical protein